MAQFNENRWRRVGADDEQIAALQALFDALDPAEQVAELARLASLSDSDLRAELSTDPVLDPGLPGSGDASLLPSGDPDSDEAQPEDATEVDAP